MSVVWISYIVEEDYVGISRAETDLIKSDGHFENKCVGQLQWCTLGATRIYWDNVNENQCSNASPKLNAHKRE